jgi:hypothetical protein
MARGHNSILEGRNWTRGGYAVDVIADPAAQRDLLRLMQRLQTEATKDALDAVRWTGWYVARSLSASTKVSAKTRRFKENRRGLDPRHPYPAWEGFYKDFRVHAGNTRTRGGWTARWYRTGDLDRAAKLRVIKFSGLAKDSWRWMASKLGSRIRLTAGRHPRAFQSMMDVRDLPSLIDPAVLLTNRVHYILAAMRTGGRLSVDSAMQRGATAGLRYLDSKIKGSYK